MRGAEDTPEQIFQKTYAADLKSVRGTVATADDLDLANKIVADAQALKQNKEIHAFMLRQACQLALEDAGGTSVAETITEALISNDGVKELQARQELAGFAAAIIRRRKLGKAEPLMESHCNWQLQVAGVARAQGDDALADRTLAAALQDAQAYGLKFLADTIRELQVWRKWDAADRLAIQQAKPKGGSNDPKLNLQAGEAILSQTGNWLAAEAYLKKANDPRCLRIAQLRKERGASNKTVLEVLLPVAAQFFSVQGLVATAGGTPAAPVLPVTPAPSPEPGPAGEAPALPPVAEAPAAPLPPASAGDVLQLADYLTLLASPPRRASLAGKAFLLEEAAVLTAMAQTLDQSNLTVSQKLGQVTRLRETKEAAAKARAEVIEKFDQECKLSWTALYGKTLADDWFPFSNFDTWKVLENGELQCIGGPYQTRLKSKRNLPIDFVLEGEISRSAADVADMVLLFRGAFNYRVSVYPDATLFLYVDGTGKEVGQLARVGVNLPVNEWISLKVVFEGDHQMVWVNGQKIIDMHYAGSMAAGPVGIHAIVGKSLFRNFRFRELK
ncbi:MAG TPA: family 16 glycoside hydrolase [Planctomycetota bacterium]|nr:family 16 glycoside hydrolase [Planctomycetota bacterium]